MGTDAIRPGVRGEARLRVAASHTAEAIGSGSVPVLSTPHMIALMEKAAASAVQLLLAPGEVSVGTRIDVRHLAATPTGVEVVATAQLVEVDGRRLVFRVEARDEEKKVGEGLHERVVVRRDRFLERAGAKASA